MNRAIIYVFIVVGVFLVLVVNSAFCEEGMSSVQNAEEGVKSSVKEVVDIISTCTEQDTEKIKSAFALLKDFPQEQVLEELIVYLDSDTPKIRRAAIVTIYKNEWDNYEKAVEPLIDLLSHKEDLTRGMAAIALGELKVHRAFNQIAELLESDGSSYARRCAAHALGAIGNKKAIPYLKRALNDPNELVRNNAKHALELLEKQ